MKTMTLRKNLLLPKISLILLLIGFTGLNSCLNEPDVEFEGYGDVYMQKKLVNGSVKYVPYYFAYANTALTSASVTLPGTGSQVSLSSFLTDNFTFSNKPADSDYVGTMPATGTYSFAVTTTEGVSHVMTDALTSAEIPVPSFDNVSYDSSNGKLSVSWDYISTASAYNIKLYKQTGEVVFSSALFVVSKTELEILQTTSGWVIGNPVLNTTYRLELNAYKFEEGATDQNYFYNVQCVSVAETTVTWGQ